MKYELGAFDEQAYNIGRGVVEEMRSVTGMKTGVASFVCVAVYVDGYLQFAGADACLNLRLDRLAAKQQAALILGRMNPNGGIDRRARLADNAQQIDNTDYYRLPCGMYLEDYIRHMRLDFATGSALKYRWRAGHKDGESAEKDGAKAAHYVRFIAEHDGCAAAEVEKRVSYLLRQAAAWDGKAVQR